MRKFKSLFLVAAALVFGLSSCNKDAITNNIEGEATYMTISLGGVVSTRDASTGVTEAPGVYTPGTIQLTHARVFVLNAAGGVVHSQEINVTNLAEPTILTVDGTPTGNNLRVLLAHSIYVVGNTPYDQRYALSNLQTLGAIHAFYSTITTQGDYTEVVLANVNAAAIPVSRGTVVSGTIPGQNPGTEMRNVVVRINPVISRLELHNVNAVQGYHDATLTIPRRFYDENNNFLREETNVETIQAQIVGFDVTGVFLDNTFGNFTYAGGGTNLRNLGTLTNAQLEYALENNEVPYYIIDTWTANDNLVAAPASGHVWAFNVASSNVPRLIIRLANIQWKPRAADDWRQENERHDPITITGIRFITVTSYTGINTFERGNIYRIGLGVDGSAGFTLTVNDVVDAPVVINPEGVNVRVGVEVQEWRFFPTTPNW